MMTLLWALAGIVVLAAIIGVYVNTAEVFGGSPDEVSRAKMQASAQFNGKTFENVIPTSMSTRSEDSPSIASSIKSMLFPPAGKNPQKPLPNKYSPGRVMKEQQMVWFGHSTVLIRTGELNIITDPVFFSASPLPIGGKPFDLDPASVVDDLPDLDVVIISHDHYDHLDMKSIKRLKDRVGQFLVPLGVKAHLQTWGVADEKIVEFDWYESRQVGDVTFTFTPTRHFSGRGLTNQYTTLWGSWVVQSSELNLYFSGDSGYSPLFKEIGDKYGPFDIAFIENGAYNEDWAEIHMFPEESVQAAVDLHAKRAFPIHWGKFDLSRHQWLEPIERFEAAVKGTSLQQVTPSIGEVFDLDYSTNMPWYRQL